MRVLRFQRNSVYSANAYLLLGEWNRIEDVNVLVDPGADPALLDFLEHAATGVGKRKLDLVVLTHRHYDHSTLVPILKARYGMPVAGWGPADELVDQPLVDGARLRFGDESFEVIHTPGHTDDSICLYGSVGQSLFVGDTPVMVVSRDASYEPAYVAALRRLAGLPVRIIYFGHGAPLAEGCSERLAASVRNVDGSA